MKKNPNYLDALNYAIGNLPKGRVLYYADIFAIHAHCYPTFNRLLRNAILNGYEKRFRMVGTRCADGFVIV